MAGKKYEPPVCPGCRQTLEFVHETSYETYTFDPETDSYKGDGYSTVDCPDCGQDLRGMPEFESGACNYERQVNRPSGGSEGGAPCDFGPSWPSVEHCRQCGNADLYGTCPAVRG